MLRTLKRLKGSMITTSNGESLGEVKDFYYDDLHWEVRYLVIDTGSWLSERLVLISPHAIMKFGFNGFNIMTNLTRKQIEESPTADKDKPISKEFEESYASYFGWPVYVTGMGVPVWYSSSDMMNTPAPDIQPNLDDVDDDQIRNKHLRSFNETLGYHIKARDEEFGHVEDMVLDDKTYKLDSLVIDTVNFWPSKSVLIAPKLMTQISWANRVFETQLSRQEVDRAPEYLPRNFIEEPGPSDDKALLP